MTVIEYVRQCGEATMRVMLSYSSENLRLAQNEAKDGGYTLKEVAMDGIC